MTFLQLFFKMNFLFSLTTDGYNLDTSHPLIYEIPDDSERGSYFGISVAIRPKAASLKETWSIQIGAPRGNVAGVDAREPGAVYRCHTYGPCRVFEMDRGLSPSGGFGTYEFKEKKDGAWTGVTMDIKNFDSHEKTVVCGHRWINRNLKNPENIDVTYLMTGVCYLQNLLNETFETPVMRLLPLVNKDKIYTPKPYVVDLSTYNWGLGQAGLSVKFSEGPSSLLIGAPGVAHWIGSVIKYENDSDVFVGSFARTELTRKGRYTYLGYSLAFGRFYKDKEFWCAAGAPRSANYRGEVFVFQFKESSGDIRMESNLVGATFGEYFGSALTAADVNSDGFDDLIVGAPLFSSKDPDEGRIYVYLGTGRGYFFVPAQVVNGRVGQGRFGSCIASVQDLDQDGYGDVAVGAPYEDNRKGAVYIYRGFAKGLQADFSQRVRARDIHPHLRGFGVSISPAVDVDGNKYLDIAIGSHLSDHAVLIRSRPVISLHPEIKTENVSLIDRRDSYVNVTVCSRYAGSNAPQHVGEPVFSVRTIQSLSRMDHSVWRGLQVFVAAEGARNASHITQVVEVDPVYGRGTLLLSKNSLVKKSIRLRPNEIVCEINTAILNITVKNEVDSCRSVKGSSLLIKGKKSEELDGFSGTCPIGNKAETSKEIPFAGICGTDLVCRSDLEITCDVPDFRSGSYTLDSSDVLLLSIRIKNYGEPAHHTKIKIWSNLKLNYRDNDRETSSSSASSTNTYWLPVQGILTESHETNFYFQIDLEALKENDEQTHINLSVEIFTSSLESNLQNNNCKSSAELASDAFLSFHASSSVASVYVTKEMIQNQTLNATHYYEFLGALLSIASSHSFLAKDVAVVAGLTAFGKRIYFIIIVTGYEHEQIVRYNGTIFSNCFLKKTPRGLDSSETSEWMQLSDRYGNKQKRIYEEGGSRDLDETMEKKNCPPTNRTLFLNCSTPENNCSILKIFFTKRIPTEFSSYVKIMLSLNATAIDLVKNEKDIVHLSTTGALKIFKFLSKESMKLERSASISLYSEERQFRVDARVIALSVLAGIFLLSLIVTGLIKSNFFERTKNQKLRALKDADGGFVYFATRATSAIPPRVSQVPLDVAPPP